MWLFCHFDRREIVAVFRQTAAGRPDLFTGLFDMMRQVLPARLFLIDSFGFIFRAYHARARTGAPPMRTSTGLSTEAVFIFNNMLRKLAKQYKPEYIAAVFEGGEATHRVQEFAEYKANRSEMPPDLGDQIPYVRRVL